MMNEQQVAQLFEGVARSHPRLLEWLKDRLEAEKAMLVDVVDHEQFKRIQGRAQFCRELLRRLEDSLKRP